MGRWDTRRYALLLTLHPFANGWKVEAITSTHASCPHLIKPHGVGVNPTEWGLLANLMRATRWGPWRMDYRRLHGAEERDIHTGGYSLPLRPAFLAFPCVQLPWNLCWIPAQISVTRLGTWLRYKLSEPKPKHLPPFLWWEVSSTCAAAPVAASWQGPTSRLCCSDAKSSREKWHYWKSPLALPLSGRTGSTPDTSLTSSVAEWLPSLLRGRRSQKWRQLTYCTARSPWWDYC